MKFFNKTTKEVYHFDADQVQHKLCQDKMKDPNFVKIPDTFDPTFDTFDPTTNMVTTDNALVLQAAKDNKLILAYDSHQAANAAPVTYKRIQYQADQASMDALAAKVNAIAAGWVVPKSFQWKALDNTLHVFKAADIKSLYLAIETRNQTNWNKYQKTKTAINACTTQAELDAVVI